jgi:CheY-like chemotaxis protein
MATVLIVDDDADNRDLLSHLFRRDGHEVACAASGKEAIDVLTQRDPTLVLLDLRMPGMDGVEFLRVIRSYLRWQMLPVIVLSGLPDDDRDRAAKYGVRHVFQKGSIDFQGLRTVVRSELARAAEYPPQSA